MSKKLGYTDDLVKLEMITNNNGRATKEICMKSKTNSSKISPYTNELIQQRKQPTDNIRHNLREE